MSTPALQFAISLIFLFLLLSALCSAIQEIIANLAKWRANTLETAIENLLGDANLKNEIYNHPLVKGIWRPRWLIKKVQAVHKPAYLSSAMFAQVLQDLRTAKGPTGLPKPTEDILNVVLKGTATVDEERKKIEHWFDDSMDAVSGWYKRKAHAWLWVISAVVCVAVNADTISIGKVLWNDPTARAAVENAAKDYLKTNSPPTATPDTGATPSADQMKKDLQKVEQARDQLNGLSVPLGWCVSGADQCAPVRQTPWGVTLGFWHWNAWDADNWILKLLGILITILAVSQGAPFWFDLLQKVANIRLAGDPPPDSRAQN